MDAKALAKSKRAHSQHHSKKWHSGHKPKAQPESSESVRNPKKPQGIQAASEKANNPIQSGRVFALPSNWDRYDEELDLGLDDTSGNSSATQHTDFIIPKSKGADFRHLIAEAEAESQSKTTIVSDGLSSLDDILHDEFSWLVGSMLSARGEGIRSWIEDDNFIVEDGSASSHEPAFLSLNLNALAEKLEVVDLHETLYIEADILPPECTAQPKVSCNQGPNQSQTTQETKGIKTVPNEAFQRDFSGKVKVTVERLEPVVPGGNLSDDYLSPAPKTNTVDQVKDIPLITGQSEKPSVDLNSSAFEDELDMLLDSFGETGIQEAHNRPHTVRTLALHAGSSDQKLQKATSNDVFEKSSAFEGTSAEAELDTLLNSYGAASLQESYDKPNPLRNSMEGTSPSDQKLPASFDDVLDDLLERTPDTVKPQQIETTSLSSVGKSKVLNEFDSWLDTI